MRVVGTAPTASALGALLEAAPADVLVVAAGQVDAWLEAIRSLVPSLRTGVLLLADRPPSDRAVGVSYVERSPSPERLAAAIRAVALGLHVLPAAASGPTSSVAPWHDHSNELSNENSPEALTGRELEVLELLAEGLGNKEMARRLGISAHTVKFHVSIILAKLGATTRTEAVTAAVRRGLLMI